MSGAVTYSEMADVSRQGLFPRYSMNTLQMNQGVNNDSDNVIFSEIGRMAGVAYTHWSWSALFADLDNMVIKMSLLQMVFLSRARTTIILLHLHNAQVDGNPEGSIKRKIEIFDNVQAI
jgi:hypothetical protein